MVDNTIPLCYNDNMKNKQKKVNKIKIRIPLSTRAGHPIGTRSGKKGYDRRDKKRELQQIIKEF
jgi:hypothetical protein